MSTLIEMLVPAAVTSAFALACLRWLPGLCPRARFWIAAAGLAAWLVPWPAIDVPLTLAGAPAAGIEPIADLELETVATARGFADAWLLAFALAAFGPGVARFARDGAAFRASIAALRRASRPGDDLRALLPAELRATPAEIRCVPGSRVALASGVLRPTIWIGDRFASRTELELALVHECLHVRARDPLAILLVTSVERVYWWNPLVAALARQAMLMIEAACDRRCAARFGRERYIESLAALMLDDVPAATPRLLAAARGTGLDVGRLELLCRGPRRTRSRDRALVAALACLAAATALASVTGPPKPAWSRVALPATPAGETLAALLDAHERGDTGLLGTYLGAYTPQEIRWPQAGLSRRIELVEILASEPRRLEYLVRDRRTGALARGRLELRDTGALDTNPP